MLVVWLLASIALSAYEVYFRHRPQDALVSLVYALFPIAVAVGLYLYGALATVRFDDTGLSVQYGPFRRARLDYVDIERGRLDSFEHVWQRSGRKPTRMIRALYKTKVLSIQLKRDDGLVIDLRRRLGPRLVFERDVVLPITHVEDAMGALKDGLVQRPKALVGVTRRTHRKGRRGRR